MSLTKHVNLDKVVVAEKQTKKQAHIDALGKALNMDVRATDHHVYASNHRLTVALYEEALSFEALTMLMNTYVTFEGRLFTFGSISPEFEDRGDDRDLGGIYRFFELTLQGERV